MALHLPPAVSVSRFIGGYKPASDYTDLSDTETNNALNVLYGPNGDIDQRLGSLKLLNSKLTSTFGTDGEPITGHYYFDKLGSSGAYNLVAAGDSLFNYTSATASRVRTGLTDNSQAFFSFIQIQDPRNPSDDIVLAANGRDTIQVWNGSSTAVTLASFPSSTGVPTCKYLLNHKEQVYAINIVDSSDVDAACKVLRSGFGSDGAADPHRFLDRFYIGGSSRAGDIRGAKVLHDQIYFYVRKSVWKFSPSSGGVEDLQEIQGSVGLFAPYSLVDVGNFHIFLSERGVYTFDGVNFQHISQKQDLDIFDGNLDQLPFAKAEFDKRSNQYKLYYASSGSNRNDRMLAYDIRLGVWQPPVTGREVSYLSNFDNGDGIETLIYGDYLGYIYEDGRGTNDGIESGFNGTVSAATYTTVTDSNALFPTAADGLGGLFCHIIDGTGEGQSRPILTNTSGVLTLERAWDIPPDATSKYTVGGIEAYWQSKDYDYGAHDLTKLYRHLYMRVKEYGNFNLTVHYIVDFNVFENATTKDVSLLDNGMAWGTGSWGRDRWDGRETIRRKISLRNTSTQSVNGTHIAFRFSNLRANETFRISGFDVELKPIGKR